MTESTGRWDRVVDVVVLGSGGAGLAAAIRAHDGGAEVLVLEKAAMVGGTTGVSGGMPWVPLNRHMADVGVDDSRDEALAYIRRLTLGREPDAALVEAYVDAAPDAIEYLEANTPLRMVAPPTFSDYFADQDRGQAVRPLDRAGAVRRAYRARRVGRPVAHEPVHAPPDDGRGREVRPRRTRGPQRRGRADGRGRPGGRARSRGRPVQRPARPRRGDADRRARRDLVVDNDAVVGVVAEQDGRELRVGARRGVVLACGGFEWNPEMVKAFVGRAVVPLSPPYNEGDGHVMAMQVGAELGNMGSVWGQPAVNDPNVTYEGRPLPVRDSPQPAGHDPRQPPRPPLHQ